MVDSEDEKMIGCLGFVAASSSMDHESTSSSKNQSNDKSKMSNVCPQADITKVTPGNCFFTFPTKNFQINSLLTHNSHRENRKKPFSFSVLLVVGLDFFSLVGMGPGCVTW